MSNLLQNNKFTISPSNQPGPNEAHWKPDFWQRREFEGILYTYPLNPHGIRLYTSRHNNTEVGGKGSVYQVLRLETNRIYRMKGEFRMESDTDVDASIFVVGFNEDETNENAENYFKKHFSISIPCDGSWSSPPIDHDFHVTCSGICKVGVMAGYGAGQFIDVRSLSLEATGKPSGLGGISEWHIPDVLPEFHASRTGSHIRYYLMLTNGSGKDLLIHAASIDFLQVNTVVHRIDVFPYSPGWETGYLKAGERKQVFNITQPFNTVAHLGGGNIIVRCHCYTERGFIRSRDYPV